MRKFVVLLAMVFGLGLMAVEAHVIVVEVSGVRGNEGMLLVMAQDGKESKPVYGMAKPENGKATIRLENVPWEKFDVSLFHDENGNYQLDMIEGKGPAEGYAMKRCTPKGEEEVIRLKLFYPITE